MASLSVHLREPGDHGRLAFHPQCPVCRGERLVGTLGRDAVVSRRTEALLSAGVLAFTSATPTVALAAGPDQEREGAAVPEQVVAGDPATDPGFDPGGDSTDLPFEVGVPEAQSSPDLDPDTGALEAEPATDEVAPVADDGDGTTTPPVAEQQTPTTEPAPPPPVSPPAPETPQASPPSPAAPDMRAAPPTPAHAEVIARAQPRTRAATGKHEQRWSKAAPSPTVRRTPAPQPEPVIAPSVAKDQPAVHLTRTQTAPGPVATPGDGRAARRGDRFHVVLPGESLWSIADDLLGEHASVARVAREVNRLWELNSERIATGDRDLLPVGTRLALR